jgi:excisionase family DNA binding protein
MNSVGISRQFLNTVQVAHMLATTETAVRLLVHRRRIPHFKVEGRVLFDRDEILKWIERHRRTAPEAVEV